MDIDQIIMFLASEEARNIVTIFILNLLGSTLGNLKTIFLSRQITKPVYVTTFIDSLIFAYAITLVASSPGIAFICSFALGKICGVSLGEFIDKRLALGTVEIMINKHLDEGITLADELRSLGYSVTTFKGYGINGNIRLIVQIILPRKHLSRIKNMLKDSPNYTVSNISSTSGKVGGITKEGNNEYDINIPRKREGRKILI